MEMTADVGAGETHDALGTSASPFEGDIPPGPMNGAAGLIQTAVIDAATQRLVWL